MAKLWAGGGLVSLSRKLCLYSHLNGLMISADRQPRGSALEDVDERTVTHEKAALQEVTEEGIQIKKS